MKAGSSAREAACAAIRPQNSVERSRRAAASALQRSRIDSTSADAPNAPMRLSRMISSFRSRVLPPPKPSAVSDSPSSCRQPVTSIVAASASAAASAGGRPSQRWRAR